MAAAGNCLGLDRHRLGADAAGNAGGGTGGAGTQANGELVLELADKVPLKLLKIPAGKFLMGSPATEALRSDDEMQHEVTISKAFHMAATDVTVDQFAAFVNESGYKTDAENKGTSFGFEFGGGAGGGGGIEIKNIDNLSWRDPGFAQKGDYPVVQVSWGDAQAFCVWLGKKSGHNVMLPTEAQWEYANRAGATTAYFWGAKAEDGKGWANAADETLRKKYPKSAANWTFFPWEDGFLTTSPAGNFKANAFGLYDMTGNVWQWCEDRYGDYDKGAGGGG